jgi:hypothetical protein
MGLEARESLNRPAECWEGGRIGLGSISNNYFVPDNSKAVIIE